MAALLRAEGVPVGGNRTEVYARTPSGRPLKIDVYEPPMHRGDRRPAALYFHAGSFNLLGRELCGGHLCWLATNGLVGFSAEYRLTNGADGAGVAGAIEDAWAALHWMRSNAKRLRIDPQRIVVWGDSAGGGLALALGTGLRPGAPPAPRRWLPAAVLAGFPVTTFGARSFLTYRRKRSRLWPSSQWADSPSAAQLPVANVFAPSASGATAEATQAQLRSVFAGGLLFFGQRRGGLLLPAHARYPEHDDAASVSPLSLASRQRLPPMLLLSANADKTVPIGQQERFAEVAREAGNEVSMVIFGGGDHGEGGVYTAAGREATLRFLGALGLLPRQDYRARQPFESMPEGLACIDGARRALGLAVGDFPAARFRWWKHKRATLRLEPRV